MKTLIVEDDFTSRLLLQTFLSRYGECHMAVNGNEAVRAFQMATEAGAPYDIICMDIVMPELSGMDALKQIRGLEQARGILSHHGVKIIMTTAVTDVKEMFRSFDGLCDAYLFKPIDTGKLLHELQGFQLVA